MVLLAGLARGAADGGSPLAAGQAWIESVSVTEERHFDPPRPGEEDLDQKFRLRTSKTVVAIVDGGVLVSSVPQGESAPRRSEYLGFEQGAPSLQWPSELALHGGPLLGRIVNGAAPRLISRRATTHALGPAHVYEVADEDLDSSASCGGLSTLWGESVKGTVTVLDGTSLIVAADLRDDESEENDRYFRDELEDGGITLITGHWLTTIRRTVTIEVSAGSRR